MALKDGAYTLTGRPLDMKRVKAVNPEPEAWHGAVNFSGTAARGNTTSEKVALTANAARRWEKDRYTGSFGYYFAQNGTTRDNKEKTEDRSELGSFRMTGPEYSKAAPALITEPQTASLSASEVEWWPLLTWTM